MNELSQAIAALRGTKILVLGDLMLDRYTWGDAERISPEAPVLVLRAESQEARAGGAASVACLLRHLDAEVTLAGVVGDDPEGRTLLRILDELRIDRRCIIVDETRPTTSKERFLGRASNRQPHQVLRVDHESRQPLTTELAKFLSESVVDKIADHQALLISDYAKGVCTVELLQSVIEVARAAAIPVLIDPARINNYARYRGASFIKPNRQEAELATGTRIHSPVDAVGIARELCHVHEIHSAFVTLDREGIALYERESRSGHATDQNGTDPQFCCTNHRSEQCESRESSPIELDREYAHSNENSHSRADHDLTVSHVEPSRARDVYDITGAGDMVLAVAGICLANGVSLPAIARLANAAAGLEVQRLGIAPVFWSEILAELAPHSTCKLLTLDQIASLAATYRAVGKMVVFTNGCFDLLHIGHVSYLQEAARLGDVLIVAINSDPSVRKLKGPTRPIIRHPDRAAMLAALSCVTHVVVFDEDTPHRLLAAIRPDVLVKGGTTAEIVGREVVEAYGGRVCTLGQIPGVSTTHLVASVAEREGLGKETCT